MELWIEFTRPLKWTIQSLIVRLFTWSKFSHCRVRLVYKDKTFVFETNPPRARYIEGISHEQKYAAKLVKLVKLGSLSLEEILRLQKCLDLHNNKPYDWPSALKIGLIKVLPWVKKWVYTPQSNVQSFFCSELCLELIETVKMADLASYNESVSPQDLFELLKQSKYVVDIIEY